MFKNAVICNNQIKAPSKSFIYEDTQCVVYEEKVNHGPPTHFSVVPKKPLSIAEGSANNEKLLGHLLIIANKIAIRKGFNGNGFHVEIAEDPNSGQVISLYVAHKLLLPVLWPITPNSRL